MPDIAGRWLTFLSLLLVTGCSISPGNKLTLFPQNHRLLDSTRAVMQAAPEPLPLPRELNKRVLPPYLVEPGDVLLVQAGDLDSPVRLPADQPVLPDGTINLGTYGRPVVAGRTVEEIEQMVRTQVSARVKEPGPITVRIVTRLSKVYYVLGDVNAPGAFPLQGRETVLDGILAAGGLTDRSSRRDIILSRPTAPDGCRIVLPICYDEIVQLGDTSTNYQLAPGDRIYVPSRSHSLFDSWPFGSKKRGCLPCDHPQVPCATSPNPCDPLFGVPIPATATPPLPSAPAAPVTLVAPQPQGIAQVDAKPARSTVP
jgi:protein involved in polysaccharide export with SLBB domain